MININGIKLEDRHKWILEKNKSNKKISKGTILLVSTQNSGNHLNVWKKAIESPYPLPEKIIFCENDSTDETRSLINSWTFPHELISFKSKSNDIEKDIYKIVAKNRQLLLNRAKEINPKFAIFIDDDVFPDDQNIIKTLISYNSDIDGGAYLRYFEEDIPYIASKWDINAPLKQLPPIVPGLKNQINEFKKKGNKYLMFYTCENKLYRVAMTSAGCLCLSRKIIQDKRINFFPRKNLNYQDLISEDFGYCLLAKKFGYEVYLDGDIKLSHLKFGLEKKRPWIRIISKLTK